MTLQLIYFAAIRDLVGLSEESFTLTTPTETVGELVAELQHRHPNLQMEGVRVAVNEEFCGNDTVLSDGDVVAFIPPVSGG